MLRIIAIGNRYKKDDAIAIAVAEELKRNLFDSDIDIIIGETNYAYCFEFLAEDDLIVILTPIYSNKAPGTISLCTIQAAITAYSSATYLTNIFYLMKEYQLSYTGYMLGIHVSNISLGIGISKDLSENFTEIYKNIQAMIFNILKNKKFFNSICTCNQPDNM